MQNAEVRDLIAKVSGDLTKLTAGLADGTNTASTKELDASWNALVAHLAIRSGHALLPFMQDHHHARCHPLPQLLGAERPPHGLTVTSLRNPLGCDDLWVLGWERTRTFMR